MCNAPRDSFRRNARNRHRRLERSAVARHPTRRRSSIPDATSTSRSAEPAISRCRRRRARATRRNGHLMRTTDGSLTTADGAIVMGEKGPIKLGVEKCTFEQDGSVRAAARRSRASCRSWNSPTTRSLMREGGALLRADGETAKAVAMPEVHGGSLENSNVSTVERIAELTNVARTVRGAAKGHVGDVERRRRSHHRFARKAMTRFAFRSSHFAKRDQRIANSE